MFQYLIDERKNKKGESSSKDSRNSKKDEGKRKEDETHTPPGNIDSDDENHHEEEDNCSKYSYHQSENFEHEDNQNATLMESFYNQLNTLMHKSNL